MFSIADLLLDAGKTRRYRKYLFIIISLKKYSSRDKIHLSQWWHISITLMRSRIRIHITVKVKSRSVTLVVLSGMCIGTFVENQYFFSFHNRFSYFIVSANVQQISELEKKSARDLMEGGQLR
jgi:hypothetical protein